MELHAKLVRAQLNFFKPFVANCSLEVTRKGQDKLGELMTAIHKREVYVREHDFGGFQGAWLTPKDKRRTGVFRFGVFTCSSSRMLSARCLGCLRCVKMPWPFS